MHEFFFNASPQVQAAVISAVVALVTTILALVGAIVATPFRYLMDKRALRHKLKSEYEYEQRKELRQLIGRYHGRILNAAESLNHRFWNLYENEGKGWLDLKGQYEDLDSYYYFRTTVYRFLNFFALLRMFEMDAIYIDSRIAEKTDLEFVKYLKAFHWIATDVALFAGLPYDAYHSTDHFFSDQLREICDSCCDNRTFVSLEGFRDQLAGQHRLEVALRFFDNLKSNEPRLRWDRIVTFHLLLMAFINAFGYDMQRSSAIQLRSVAARIKNHKVVVNLEEWLTKLGLAKHRETKLLIRAMINVERAPSGHVSRESGQS